MGSNSECLGGLRFFSWHFTILSGSEFKTELLLTFTNLLKKRSLIR